MNTFLDGSSVDRVLKGLIGIFEAVFPNRVRGYYVEGSYASKTAIATSDIDLVIVFKGGFIDEAEHKKAVEIAEFYDLGVQAELDSEILDEVALEKGVSPSLKLGSSVLFGDPLPDRFPLLSAANWGRERMHAAYWLMNKVFGRPNIVTSPFTYPMPEAEFYGYTERQVRLDDGRMVNSTRDLIRVMGWAGSALIASIGNQVVARKKDCHTLYRELINDEWSSFLEAMYTKCRQEWHYLVPEDSESRKELKLICQRALEFENHFLQCYKRFLLSELNDAELVSKLDALKRLEKIPFVDQEVIELVKTLAVDGQDQIRPQAEQTLGSIVQGG